MWLIISDTHDNMEKVKTISQIIEEKNIKRIFHCGDIIAPFVLPYLIKPNIEFYGVYGNNDGEKLFLNERSQGKIKVGPVEMEIENYKILIMHEPFLLEAAIKSQIYDFIFYGHTHQIDTRVVGNTLVINPGEACGYLTNKSTVVLLNPENKKYEILEI